jgi:DNA repair exonuclease SbcCD ATPase subunit
VFLEGQLRSADETLRLTKESYGEAAEVMEHELEGLEQEANFLKELYNELKTLHRIGQQQPTSPSTPARRGASYAHASLTIDWSRYESAKHNLLRAEQQVAELSQQLEQIKQKLSNKDKQLNDTTRQLKTCQTDNIAIKEELVRTGQRE